MPIRVTAERQADWDAAIVDLIQRVKQTQPDELASDINASIRPLGLDITLFLVDLEQNQLWAMPERGKPTAPPVPVEGSMAGRTFTSVTLSPGRTDEHGLYRMWVPMVDGSDRLGVGEVLAYEPPVDPELFQRRCVTLIGLIGHMVGSKLPYGDAFHKVQRTRPMAPSGELILSMMPPLTFSHHRMAISAILEPHYEVGGDAFDYAVDGSHAQVLVLDAMGRGLRAALTSAAALSAIRAVRRDDRGLYDMGRAADAAVTASFGDVRFVTGVLADLDLDTGGLRYLNAGHPEPILFRRGRAVRTLTGGRRMPLGLDDSSFEVGEETLQPGDRLLLYTDGVTEAYDSGGERFGVDRLVDLTERGLASRLPAAETMRRLAVSVRSHQVEAADDATLLLVEWSAEAAKRSVP